MIVEYVALTLLVLMLMFIIFSVLMIIKTAVAYNQRMRVIYAIYEYRKDMIIRGEPDEVDFFDMEDDEKTVYRLWDWSYKRILPPDKMAIIKPYIR